MMQYDSRLPNYPVVDGVRAPPARPSLTARQAEKLHALECRVADLEAERDDLREVCAAQARSLRVVETAAAVRLARQEEIAGREAHHAEMLHAIAAIAAAAGGIEFDQLLGPRRARRLARPRQMVCYLARQHCPGLSLPDIARLLRRKDHTTVLHACRATEARLSAGEAATTELYLACAPVVADAVARLNERAAAKVIGLAGGAAGLALPPLPVIGTCGEGWRGAPAVVDGEG